jgi:eukaryotic-like serine/threonine-protein kinase
VHTVVVKPGDEVAGRYRLEELQGHGPMSEVWRAHDDSLDRTVAVKMLSPTADLERFRREARALAGLAHENVMRVFDYGEDESGPFMALEWLPNGTLEERLAQGPLPPAETRRVAEAIAAGLAHLHSAGLVHRDLKPANVLFDEEDRPKLADFGLARRAVGPGTLTEAGTVLGTAAYISPEQAGGEPAGPASDVYSFGVILFRMLTGALPFAADEALALLALHRNAPPPAVETLQPNAPPELAALTAAALRKDPAQRPADGEALLAALGGAAGPVSVAADTKATQVMTPVAPRERGGGGHGRRTALIALALLVLAASGAVLAWAVTRPASTAPTEKSTGSVPGTVKTHPHTTPTTQAPTTSAPTIQPTTHPATTRRQTTTAPTTGQIPTTTIPTTIPTETLPTTTLPTTTLPTTTAATGTVSQSSTTTSTQSSTTVAAAH